MLKLARIELHTVGAIMRWGFQSVAVATCQVQLSECPARTLQLSGWLVQSSLPSYTVTVSLPNLFFYLLMSGAD